MLSSRESIKRGTRWLTLLGLLLLFIAGSRTSYAQGPTTDGSDLRHGPAIDTGDPILSQKERQAEQAEFERLARKYREHDDDEDRSPAAAPAQTIRVYVLDFNPTIDGVSLATYRKWNDPTLLMQVYNDDVRAASWDSIGFQIVQHSIVDGYPAKPGGFAFTNAQYLGCLSNPAPSYCLQIIDYQSVLNTVYDPTYMSACDAVASGQADEIWLWGGPFFGYWEYVLVEPWSLCRNVNSNFAVMGFSYERTDAEMLHDLGHRSEGVLQAALGLELWDRFDGQRWRYAERYGCPSAPDGLYPEVDAYDAHNGNVHFPPNAYCHYQYARDFSVQSDADDWLDYPHLADQQTTLNSADWNTNQRGFLLWWFEHFPHNSTGGDTNWWNLVFERVTIPYLIYYFPEIGR